MALEADTLAPDFELPDQFGVHVRLSDYRGRKPVALVFFPLAFSSTCTGELCEIRDNLALFQDSEVALLGVSVDSKSTLRAFAEAEQYDFPLLADFWPHGAVAKDYGVFLPEKGFANRASFLIDTSGIIRQTLISAPGTARPFSDYRDAVASLVPARI